MKHTLEDNNPLKNKKGLIDYGMIYCQEDWVEPRIIQNEKVSNLYDLVHIYPKSKQYKLDIQSCKPIEYDVAHEEDFRSRDIDYKDVYLVPIQIFSATDVFYQEGLAEYKSTLVRIKGCFVKHCEIVSDVFKNMLDLDLTVVCGLAAFKYNWGDGLLLNSQKVAESSTCLAGRKACPSEVGGYYGWFLKSGEFDFWLCGHKSLPENVTFRRERGYNFYYVETSNPKSIYCYKVEKV
jgi:hypothetical protein